MYRCSAKALHRAFRCPVFIKEGTKSTPCLIPANLDPPCLQSRRSLTLSHHFLLPIPKNIEDIVQLESVNATLNKGAVVIDETSYPGMTKISAPTYTIDAKIKLSGIPTGAKWEVGWIQAVQIYVAQNTYGTDGQSYWEILQPELGRWLLKNTCDGTNYPWLGHNPKHVRFVSDESGKEATVDLELTEHVNAFSTWHTPVPPYLDSLTNIFTRQDRFTWIIVYCTETRQFYNMKTIWHDIHLNVDVDCSKPCGSRCSLVDQGYYQKIEVLPKPTLLKYFVLNPPRFESVLSYYWRSLKPDAEPQLIIHNPCLID